jgi:hypothetical protein
MATKLYLRATTHSISGSMPTYPEDGLGGYFVANTSLIKELKTAIGAGQTSKTGSSLTQTAGQDGNMGGWTSLPFDVNQTVGGGTITLNIAVAESNTNMNLGDGATGGAWKVQIYVWRPSTGAKVGNVVNSYTTWNTTEPNAASTEKVIHGTVASSAVSALAGDIVVVELAVLHLQSMASSYNLTVYYDGTTENTTTNTTVTNHASFVQFTENLTFSAGSASVIVDPMGMMGIFGV